MENILESEMVIGIGDVSFNGLKFSKNIKNSLDFYEKLTKEDNVINRMKFKNAMVEELREEIHIKLSWSLVLKYFGLALFVITLMMILAKASVFVSLGLLATSVTSSFMSSKVRDKASDQESLLTSDAALENTVDMMFFDFE